MKRRRDRGPWHPCAPRGTRLEPPRGAVCPWPALVISFQYQAPGQLRPDFLPEAIQSVVVNFICHSNANGIVDVNVNVNVIVNSNVTVDV